jgi:hypothetical protein
MVGRHHGDTMNLRLLTHNGLVFLLFAVSWCLLALIEVKVKPFSILKYLFILSLPSVFVAFYIATWSALATKDSGTRIVRSVAATVVLSPFFILVGGIVCINFKFWIGGHI